MRAVIYTRVSSEEQIEGYSLDAQREICERLIETRGWSLVGVYSDPGRSGKSPLRPSFQAMIADAGTSFDVVVVHKLDRFSRALLDILVYLNKLGDKNVSFISATEQFDFTSPFGRVILVMLGAFAQWYLDNLSAETSKGKKQRALSGGWNGSLSFGYSTPARLRGELVALNEDYRAQRLSDDEYSQRAQKLEDEIERFADCYDSQAVPHHHDSSGVLLAYTAYANGDKSDNDVAWMLNNAGYRIVGRYGLNTFSKDTIRDLLQNRFYIGETSYKKQQITGDHQPIISIELFEQCQHVRAGRKNKSFAGHNRRETYVLSERLFCECGYSMRGWRLRDSRRYRCAAHERGHKCDIMPKSIHADDIERQIADIIKRIEIPEDWLSRVDQPAPAVATVDNSAKLERLRRLFVLGDIDETEYKRMRDDLIDNTPAPSASVRDASRVVELLKNMGAIWDNATLDERQRIVAMLFDEIHLEAGRIKTVKPSAVLWALLDTPCGSDGDRSRIAYRVELEWFVYLKTRTDHE